MNIVDVLMVLAAAQGVFLGVLILHKYRGLLANRFLVGLLFLHSGILLQMSLQNVLGLDRWPQLLMGWIGAAFLVGPLHYLYAKYLARPGQEVSRREIVHFLPYLVYLALVIWVLKPGPCLQEAPEGGRLDPAWFRRFGWFHLAVMLQYGGYLVQTQRALGKYGRQVRAVYSSLEQVRLTWLRNITWLALVVVGIYALEFVFMLLGIKTAEYFTVSSVLLVAYVYVMGYLGLFKSEVLSGPLLDALQNSQEAAQLDGDFQPEASTPAKYSKSGLSGDDLARYQEKLLGIMAEKAPHNDSGLNLEQLAGLAGLSPHNLSEVINRGQGQNFFDFVNGYRVEQVKTSLLDPEKAHLTILALALEAGFASKSTFNTIFKKHTGLTPSAWRKKTSES